MSLTPNDPLDEEVEPQRPFSEILRHLFGGFTRWRNSFTREKLTDAVKTLAWIGPLTVLIWVYAEREQVGQRYGINDVPIEITSNDMFVEPSANSPAKITLFLSGPQAGLEQVKDRLLNGLPRGLLIDLGNSLNPGRDQQVNVLDRIQNWQPFKDAGVTVAEVVPSQIAVDVDKYAQQELDVQSPPFVTNLNKATTHYDPRKVLARGPAAVLRDLDRRGLLKAYPDIAASDILKSPGLHDITASLTLPPLPEKEDRVRFIPNIVKATLDVRAADASKNLEYLRIFVEGPPALLDKNKLEFTNGEQTTIPNITVTGPQAQLDLLPSPQYWAALVLTGNEAIGQELSRTLEYHLPPGVTVTPDQEKVELRFKLTPRGGAD